MNIPSCISGAAGDRFASFKANGKLDLEGTQRKDLSPAEATDLYTQFQGQMDQIIGLDNIAQADKNSAPGQIDSDVLGDGVNLKACFEGDTKIGTISGEIASAEQNSQFVTEFNSGAMTVIQMVDLGGGQTGTIAASINPQGQSFMETHNVPEGAVLLG